MSGDIVNLRMFRKRKEREAREAEAAGNRARHGRTKAERAFDAARGEAVERTHEGRLLRPEAGTDDGPASA